MSGNSDLVANAVIEGGGVCGIALVGAISVAEEKGYRWNHMAGTSAGAIVAALLTAGYSAVEIKEIMLNLDYKHFRDAGLLARIPLVGPKQNLFEYGGIYKGEFLDKWIGGLLENKGVKTFGDLLLPAYEKDDRRRFKLRVIATDVSRGRMLVLPQDIADYGLQPDELSVAHAIRMSMSIPFFYEPVKLVNAKTGQISYIVDGGVSSNFPLWLFDMEGESPGYPTFGFKLVSSGESRDLPQDVKGPISFFAALFTAMLRTPRPQYFDEEESARTIAIPDLGIHTANFDLTLEMSNVLFQSGRQAAQEFFSTWDFNEYINQHSKFVPFQEVLKDYDQRHGTKLAED